MSTTPFDAVVLSSPEAQVRLAGMRLLERMLFTLARAGATRLLCVGTRPAGHLRLPETSITWSADGAEAAAWAARAPAVIVVDAAAVVDADTVRALATAPSGGRLMAAGPVRLWRCDAKDLPPLLDAALAAERMPAGASVWTPPFRALLVRADTTPARRDAERVLFTRSGRPGDGWFTRVFDRRISRLLTRALVPTGISPNLVTACSVTIGIASGFAFATGDPALAIVGAFAFLLSTIIDGCDGEIARLTFRESRLGARLDLVGDNLVHLFLFGGIACGVYRVSPGGQVVVLGILLLVGVLVSMAAVYRCILQRVPTPAQKGLYEAFASREFAYLLAGLTLVGHLDWFLWLAAGGTYAFAGALLWLGRSQEVLSEEGLEGG
jgi:phosphatidylglycerophosphate synthase